MEGGYWQQLLVMLGTRKHFGAELLSFHKGQPLSSARPWPCYTLVFPAHRPTPLKTSNPQVQVALPGPSIKGCEPTLVLCAGPGCCGHLLFSKSTATQDCKDLCALGSISIFPTLSTPQVRRKHTRGHSTELVSLVSFFSVDGERWTLEMCTAGKAKQFETSG